MLLTTRQQVETAGWVAWLVAFMSGSVAPDDLDVALRAAGVTDVVAEGHREPAVVALSRLRSAGHREVHLLFPTPGHAQGLVGTTEQRSASLSNGQAVICTPPGRPLDTEWVVATPSAAGAGLWQRAPVPPDPSAPAAWPHWGSAREAFLTTTAAAAEHLAGRVARSPSAGSSHRLRDPELPTLPPTMPAPARELLARATTVLGIVRHGRESSIRGRNGTDTHDVEQMLRRVERTALDAMAAASCTLG